MTETAARSRSRGWVHGLVLISLMTALTIVGAQVQIPVGPVPVTLQTMLVLMAGILLGPRDGALSQLLFVAAGLLFPVFASRQVGIAAVLHPAFGFAAGFVLAALVCGWIATRVTRRTVVTLFLAALAGTLVIYATGVFHVTVVLRWLTGTTWEFGTVLSVFLLPFLAGDLLKCLAVALATRSLLRAAPSLLPHWKGRI